MAWEGPDSLVLDGFLLGTSDFGRSLAVVFLVEDINDETVARIISARRRTR